ncbi:cobalt transporter ATP-binding subunit [Legionella wadsworthii]|uniref:Cobalt transporter ATP-binding subunit n=1 Tax=Legionella wadsworthii TaxID=28088 RepID=A0A378LP70_9GAMM|nr:AAA family ATPase [Legionella wadsworthii]STY28477.1 cobalt transporter ATP-binding subunit [Legionella wadsworthii]
MDNKIRSITIKGYKSIVSLDNFQLNDLNVLIGANGSGKSNFVSFLLMLREIVEKRLQTWTKKQGGADRLLSFGIKETSALSASIRFGKNGYDIKLEPTVDGGFVFVNENLYFDGPKYGITKPYLGSGHNESLIPEEAENGNSKSVATFCLETMKTWMVYHFHDTSVTAGVKRYGSIHDNEYLRNDASNLAAFLYKLSLEDKDSYRQICKTIKLVIPFFSDFNLVPRKLPTEEEQINLGWKHKDSDYPFWPSQLSDGSLRFICLATTLLQPNPPSVIVIDEPELGLHPYAIVILASLLRSASKRMQVIISTQSVTLVNEFEMEELIIVESNNGKSSFNRYKNSEFSEWLDNYSLGELWEKNILGGKP